MLNNLDLNLNTSSNSSKDSQIAKNIIDKLFIFVDACFRNDKKMSIIVKTIALNQLPGIAKGSRVYIDKMNNVTIKKLLDDIEYEINKRK